MKDIEFFSIVIPLYNKENTIVATIHSVLNQDYPHFELIIVNDGSTDDSLKIIEKIADPRIKIYTKLNEGVSATRNYGVEKATGEFIFFLDADDIMAKNCLSVFKRLIIDYPFLNFYTANFFAKGFDKQTKCCSRRERGIVKYPFKEIWQRKIFPRTGAMVIRKETFIEAGRFREECNVWEDLELVLNLLTKNHIAYDPIPVFIHNLEFNELSQKIKPIQKEYAYYIDLYKAKNFYHKFLLLELLDRTIKIRRKLNDEDSVRILNEKFGNRMPFLYSGKIERYILKHFRLLTSKPESA